MSELDLNTVIETYQKYGTKTKAAEFLGISVKKLNKLLNSFYSDPNEAIIAKNCNQYRIPIDDVAYAWVKNKEVSMFVRRKGEKSYGEMRDQIIKEMNKHSPVYSKIEHKSGGNLLIIDPADIHIGKLSKILETGSEYNISLAVERTRKGITELLAKAEPFGIAKIVFVIGNDVLHIDSPHRKTTSGTPQDTDGQWWEMFLEAKRCYVAAIEEMTQIADVHVIFCPSNHDYVSGWMLADTIQSWFRNNPNVSFGENSKNVSISHRKYIEFGQNLIGFTHGDGAKEADLPLLMQQEARSSWGRTTFSYWYTHHLHHKVKNVVGLNREKLEKDHIGVTVLKTGQNRNPNDETYVELVRSPSPADGWHARNGYVNKQAVEAFIHDPNLGQVARLTHYF